MNAFASHALAALALSIPLAAMSADGDTQPDACKPGKNDSVPTSLGADGWATADGPVTGGCGAAPSRVHHVYNRAQLVAALTRSNGQSGKDYKFDHKSKIVYVHGLIDLNVDDDDVPLKEEDYMRQCGYTAHATYYDPATGDQTGSGGFFGAYKATYDPNQWIRQSLDPADNRPPALSGPLEEARLCFQRKQAERVQIYVPSNTSIIGVGIDAGFANGNLRLGYANDADANDPATYKASNVVIRNLNFQDAFDMFSSWDPKDSFSITITNSNGCQAVFDAALDAGPHRCTIRGGRWNAEYDSVSIFNAERVWVDHNTFTDSPRIDKLFPPTFAAPFNEATQKVQHHDGQVDVTLLGSKVTISNNVFVNHDKTNLLGGSDRAGLIPGYGPGRIDVTFHGNHFKDTVQRMPRVRFGRVHVYNNYYQVTRLSNADYRLGDSWILGTASKLVTENNLFDIRNTNFSVPRIVNYSSNLTNAQVCVDAGFSAAQCGTYYRDQGTYVTMVTATSLNETLFDGFAAAQAVQQSSASNAPLTALDPLDPAVFWLPAHSYPYLLHPVDAAADRAALRQAILDNAGAGKL